MTIVIINASSMYIKNRVNAHNIIVITIPTLIIASGIVIGNVMNTTIHSIVFVLCSILFTSYNLAHTQKPYVIINIVIISTTILVNFPDDFMSDSLKSFHIAQNIFATSGVLSELVLTKDAYHCRFALEDL